MNQLILIILLFVLFIYFGVPSVLKKNKNLLLGVVGGLVLCSFFSMRIEGLPPSWDKGATETGSCGADYMYGVSEACTAKDPSAGSDCTFTPGNASSCDSVACDYTAPVAGMMKEILKVCCKDTECDKDGYPDECSPECSNLFMSYYNDCEEDLYEEANTEFYNKCRENYPLSGTCPPLANPDRGRWNYHNHDGTPTADPRTTTSNKDGYARLICDKGFIPHIPGPPDANRGSENSDCIDDTGYLNWTHWKNECVKDERPCTDYEVGSGNFMGLKEYLDCSCNDTVDGGVAQESSYGPASPQGMYRCNAVGVGLLGRAAAAAAAAGRDAPNLGENDGGRKLCDINTAMTDWDSNEDNPRSFKLTNNFPCMCPKDYPARILQFSDWPRDETYEGTRVERWGITYRDARDSRQIGMLQNSYPFCCGCDPSEPFPVPDGGGH